MLEVRGGVNSNYIIQRVDGTLTITPHPSSFATSPLRFEKAAGSTSISWIDIPGLVLLQSTNLVDWSPVDGVNSEGIARSYSYGEEDQESPTQLFFSLGRAE